MFCFALFLICVAYCFFAYYDIIILKKKNYHYCYYYYNNNNNNNNNNIIIIVRFCCNPREFCILGIDPTFNLEDFSLTVTTYWHLQLVDRKTKKPSVMIGPMLVHQQKTTQSYHFLSSSKVGLCPKLASLQAFGTDGEIALADAFQLQFKSAVHLVCFLHVKDCIVRKL